MIPVVIQRSARMSGPVRSAAARVRVKATTMAMLGVDMGSAGPAAEAATPQPSGPEAAGQTSAQPAVPSIPGMPEAGRALDAIKGLFGR